MILNFLILPAMKLNVKAEMNEAMLKMRSSFTAELGKMWRNTRSLQVAHTS